MKENILRKSESALVAKKIFIERMSFCRNEVANGMIHLSQSSIEKNIEKIGEDNYRCSLELRMSDAEESAELEIVVSGFFEFKADLKEEQKDVIITKNTMAILFPYLRAQATLVTSQPDVEPVVIPAININALLQNIEG